jgi:hypothetical protein
VPPGSSFVSMPHGHGDFPALGVKHRIKSSYAAGCLPGPQFQALRLAVSRLN